MKKYLSIAILSASLAGFTSCDMDAPSKSSLEPEIIYSTYEVALNNVMAINECFGETNSYRGRFIPYYGLNTDCEWLNSPTYSSRATGKYNATQYDTDPGNDQLNVTKGPYDSFYQGIERANIALANMDKYSDLSDKKFQQLYGEALTLRALLYMDLIRAYGDVPARFSETTNENTYLPRTSQDVILRQLLKDLEKAAEFCAWPSDELITNTERVSKTFAKALRARCALWLAGYALHDNNGTPDYRLCTSDAAERTELYTIAKQECEDIINQNSNTLESTFEGLWKKVCQEDHTNGGEILWNVPFRNGRGRVVSALGVRHDIAKDQFIEWASDKSGGGVVGPVPTLWYDYDAADTRRDVTITLYKWNISDEDQKKGSSVAKQEPYQLKSMCFGKYRYEWMKRKATSQDDGVGYVFMRLADVYLMAAEACNELNDLTNAKKYIQPVMDRAYGSSLASIKISAATDQATMLKLIQDERKFEFAGEAIRKHDLIRWGIIDKAMADSRSALQNLAGRKAPYNNVNAKLYYAVKTDNTITMYGQRDGETSEDEATIAAKLGVSGKSEYKSKGWFEDSDGKANLTDDIINGVYVVDKPSLHCLWPIPTSIISKSNGLLNNNFLGK